MEATLQLKARLISSGNKDPDLDGRLKKTQPMKITFVMPPLGLSGGNKVVAIYSQELSRMGHTVTVISPPFWPRVKMQDKIKSLLKGRGWPLKPKSHFGGLPEHIVLDSCGPVVDADVPDADVIIATWWETAEWVN